MDNAVAEYKKLRERASELISGIESTRQMLNYEEDECMANCLCQTLKEFEDELSEVAYKMDLVERDASFSAELFLDSERELVV